MTQFNKSLVWFRRDLRNFDHAALYHALKQSKTVYCVFIFDKEIIDSLPRADRRIEFLQQSVTELDQELRAMGGALIVQHARAADAIAALVEQLDIDAVFVNRDYEPQAIARDADVTARLAAAGRLIFSFKDQVIFEQDEVLSLSAKPFSVFTPYKNAWLKKLATGADDFYVNPYPIEPYAAQLAAPLADARIPSLAELGFEPTNLSTLRIPTGMSGGQSLLEEFLPRLPDYDQTRNFPAVKGPSYLSVHLRFGTVSIRALARLAVDTIRRGAGGTGAAVWLSELIWRDFYFMILHYHPHVAERAFKPEYDKIEWETGDAADQMFAAWCDGKTGYPLVDAAMLQLNQTGYMHNRLRMVTACFLIKDLGIDYRRGERYFAEKLNDYDLSANNGGWQWASSSGCDAQPYFRIFNPVTQSEKFDAEGKFIRRYLPQLSKLANKQIHAPWQLSDMELRQKGITLGVDYPVPVVMHDVARKITLDRYSVVKKSVAEVPE